MPARRSFSSKVELPQGIDWSLLATIERSLIARLPEPDRLYGAVTVVDDAGSTKADTVEEAREAVLEHASPVKFVRLARESVDFVSECEVLAFRNMAGSAEFKGADEAQVLGFAAALQRALDRVIGGVAPPSSPLAPPSSRLAPPRSLLRPPSRSPLTPARRRRVGGRRG